MMGSLDLFQHVLELSLKDVEVVREHVPRVEFGACRDDLLLGPDSVSEDDLLSGHHKGLLNSHPIGQHTTLHSLNGQGILSLQYIPHRHIQQLQRLHLPLNLLLFLFHLRALLIPLRPLQPLLFIPPRLPPQRSNHLTRPLVNHRPKGAIRAFGLLDLLFLLAELALFKENFVALQEVGEVFGVVFAGGRDGWLWVFWWGFQVVEGFAVLEGFWVRGGQARLERAGLLLHLELLFGEAQALVVQLIEDLVLTIVETDLLLFWFFSLFKLFFELSFSINFHKLSILQQPLLNRHLSNTVPTSNPFAFLVDLGLEQIGILRNVGFSFEVSMKMFSPTLDRPPMICYVYIPILLIVIPTLSHTARYLLLRLPVLVPLFVLPPPPGPLPTTLLHPHHPPALDHHPGPLGHRTLQLALPHLLQPRHHPGLFLLLLEPDLFDAGLQVQHLEGVGLGVEQGTLQEDVVEVAQHDGYMVSQFILNGKEGVMGNRKQEVSRKYAGN